MKLKLILITIDVNGNISMLMKGYKGQGCMSDALDLVKKIGAKNTLSLKKKLYYQRCDNLQKQQLNDK